LILKNALAAALFLKLVPWKFSDWMKKPAGQIQIYLGKVPDTEAMRWIENLYTKTNLPGVRAKKAFILETGY